MKIALTLVATISAFVLSAKADSASAIVVPGKIGYVKSPYAPEKGVIDVRGFEKGAKVKDPYTGRIFVVPADYTKEIPAMPESEKTAEGFRFKKLNLEETTIENALAYIGEQSKIKIHFSGARKETDKITLRLTNISAAEALHYVANAAKMNVTYKEDGVHIAP